MEIEIKMLLFEIIYNKMGLKNIEDRFVHARIKPKEIVNSDNYPILSNYFFLLSEIHFENLSDEEMQLINSYYVDYKNNIDNSKDKLCELLSKLIYTLLIPNTSEKMLYWGGNSYKNAAPANSIVLSLHYIEFSTEDDDVYNVQRKLIDDSINYIQEDLSNSTGLNVSIVEFNEVPQNKRSL